jgi:hypothetical protein
MEEWKVISDYPNYSVSSFGNVRNDKTGKLLKIQPNHQNYCRVCLCKDGISKFISLHYLVFKHHSNTEINDEIDHIDRNRLNNNISNLRIANRQLNSRNTNKRKGCSSNYKGVSYYKSRCKWIAKITINYKGHHLGCFQTEAEAGIAYNNYIIENNLEGFVLNEINF